MTAIVTNLALFDIVAIVFQISTNGFPKLRVRGSGLEQVH